MKKIGTQLDKNITKPLYSKKYQEKRTARVLAIQAIYAHNYTQADFPLDQVIFDIIKDSKSQESLSKLSASDEKLIITLTRGTEKNLEKLKEIISGHLSKEWRFDRLGKVMQAILLVAAYEMQMNPEFDKAIIINEYIEITKMFNHEGEAGFVNSVLDGIAKTTL